MGENRQKWAEMGDNLNMPCPQRGRSIKNMLSNNNDSSSITKYGFLVQLGAQICALHAQCAKGAPLVVECA